MKCGDYIECLPFSFLLHHKVPLKQKQAQCPATKSYIDTSRDKSTLLTPEEQGWAPDIWHGSCGLEAPQAVLQGSWKIDTSNLTVMASRKSQAILPSLEHVPLILLWVEREKALWPSLLPFTWVQSVHHLRVHLIGHSRSTLFWCGSYQLIIHDVNHASWS